MTGADLDNHPFPVQLRALDVHDHNDQLREMTDALHNAAVILRMLERDDHLPAETPLRLGLHERRALCYFANHTLDLIATSHGNSAAKFTDRIFGQLRAQAQKITGEEEA